MKDGHVTLEMNNETKMILINGTYSKAAYANLRFHHKARPMPRVVLPPALRDPQASLPALDLYVGFVLS